MYSQHFIFVMTGFNKLECLFLASILQQCDVTLQLKGFICPLRRKRSVVNMVLDFFDMSSFATKRQGFYIFPQENILEPNILFSLLLMNGRSSQSVCSRQAFLPQCNVTLQLRGSICLLRKKRSVVNMVLDFFDIWSSATKSKYLILFFSKHSRTVFKTLNFFITVFKKLECLFVESLSATVLCNTLA